MNFKEISMALCCLFLLPHCGQDVKIVEVEPTTLRFTKSTQTTKVEAKAQDIHGAPIANIPISFRSEDPSVATVDSGGLVKPAGNGSTAIVASTQGGVEGEAFVKVCLPKELICDPADTLKIKVGLAAPIKCHVTNCKDERVRDARIELTSGDRALVLKEGDNVYIGLAVGDTNVTAKSLGLETQVAIHIDEQEFLPGMGPGSVSPSRGKGGGGKKDGDPYGGSGRFDHILKNMKVSVD